MPFYIVIYDLESLINNGWTILIPSSFIKIDEWGGIGYIAIDTTGERAFYYRYGGYGYNGSTRSSDLNQNGRAITIPIPIPFPIVAVAAVVAVIVIASVYLVSTTVENVEELIEIEKFKNETKEIEIAKTQNYPSDNHYKVYYHATTMDSAKIILSTNQLIPTKNVDGGLVYAWTICPDERAIAGSGSQNANVIVRFETVSAFTRDPTVTDEYALLFMPMRAVIPGSIPIKNPIIITNIKKNWFWRIKNILTKG